MSDTTLGLTVDGATPTASLNGSIDLPAVDDRPRGREGAGILFYGPALGLVLIAVVVLAARFILRAVA